jgi:hypothetical protein
MSAINLDCAASSVCDVIDLSPDFDARRRYGGYLEAFPIPLGSTDILSNALSPAAFGRSASKYPVAAGLRLRANEAASMGRTTNDAKTTFTEVFDMVAPLFTGTPYLGADVGLQAATAIKLYFGEHFSAFVRTESICTEEVENR